MATSSTPPDTQKKSTIPLSDVSCTAAGSFQWNLEKDKDEKAPVFHYNNLAVYICGEDGFKQIAKDIQAAEESIDIVCWGFDPAMELIRDPGLNGRDADTWPRGVTWGDLLRDATGGKLASKKKIKVRLLAWHDPMGSAIAGNMPGYKKGAAYELKAASGRGMAAAFAPRGESPALPEPTEVSDKREVFNSHFFRDVVAGKIDGLSMRTRGSIHDDVMASYKKAAHDRGGNPDFTERLAFELLATHHQKTIVIDYDGAHPRAYVMGLNSVTDYWDTQEHIFNDPRRGRNFEGDDKDHSVGTDWERVSSGQPTLKPYQDYACRLEGEAVMAVFTNFAEGWDKARIGEKCAGSNIGRKFDLKRPPKNLTQNLKAPLQSAQIVRTMPTNEGGERSIERLYYQASSFARHYLYIENQYFQNPEWVNAIKKHRDEFVKGFSAAQLAMAKLPILHVMVVTPTPERPQMVPRTHDTVKALGQGDSMPDQDKGIEAELKRHREATARYEQAMARGNLDPDNAPAPLSPQATDSLAQGEKVGIAKQLSTLGIRTLVASLWSYDPGWILTNTSVGKKAEEETRRYRQALTEWERYQAEQADARARSINAGGWGGSADSRIRPLPPPERSKELQKATAQRYREIYIHAKLMVIDDSMFTLGSANLNLRSFAVDSEINIASDDAVTAKDLRQRVWKQHTNKQFDGGSDATDQRVIYKTFSNWETEASENADKKAVGESLSSFLIAFHDERTSLIRGG